MAYLLVWSAAVWVSPPRRGLAHKGQWRKYMTYPVHCFRKEDKQTQSPQPYFLPSTVQTCHLFCFGAKRSGGKRAISQKQTKRRRWRLGEQCWFLFHGCQRETPCIWQNIHQHSSTLSSGTNTSLNCTFFPFPASGVVQMSFIPACLSFLFSNWVWLVGSLSSSFLPFFRSFFLLASLSLSFLRLCS